MLMFAHVLNDNAKISRRSTVRRALQLTTVAEVGEGQSSQIMVRNLSQTGLLIETSAAFDVGEIFYLHLPEIGATPVQVRRKDGDAYGCEFLAPVGKVAISAALLKSAFTSPGEEDVEELSEQRLIVPRFFGDQSLPVHQSASAEFYIISTVFSAFIALLAWIMANGNLIVY
ncbi:MAG TPA: PilZ domain-containing protein [Sphingopyxis sp.]|nr:PilZ domain-containing protein [Sphingopyxis sp.]